MQMNTSASDDFDTTRRKWRVASRVTKYAALQGWIDAGERLGISTIADEVRGTPVLDLGVGAGRTAWLMRLLTDDYVGVDWSPEMVVACHAGYPGLDVRQGDARNLSFVRDGSIKLVFFSYNGIDYNDHDGRVQAMAEISRVLRPDGIVAYSTFSKNGPLYGERPWTLNSGRMGRSHVRALVSFIVRLPAQLPQYRTRYANWWKNKNKAKDHGEWAIAPAAHLDFELVHFTTATAERDLLATAGLTMSQIITRDGVLIDVNASTVETPWFFVVARKSRTDGN